MLQNIRDNSKGVISYILIGFLVVIFALFGVESLFNWNPSANKVAEVNGEVITQTQLENAIARQKQQMMARYGEQIPSEFLSDEYLRKPALESLIQSELLHQAAEKMGMAIGKDLINQKIIGLPMFQGESGAFDNARYQQVLGMMGYTHGSYTQQLAKDLLLNQLYTGLSASSFATAGELDELIALNYQTRDFSYMVLPAEKLKAGIVVMDEEAADYYQKNPQAYTSDEQVAVDYIDLSVDALMAGVSVTEEQLRKQYEQNMASFVAAPERQAAHILIENKDEAKIKAVQEKLAAGEDFAALAKAYSDDQGSKEQGGDLGFTKGDTFPAEFEQALAALKVGEVSAPVTTEAGVHFIKLLSERGTAAPSFDEQRAQLEEQLKRAEAESIFVAKLGQLKDLSFNADNLADVATELDLTVVNTGLFSRSSASGVAANKQFVDAAFSEDVLQQGNASEPVELDASRVLVLKKTDYQPSRLLPLADVKDQVVSVLSEAKLRDLVREKGSQLVAAVRAGSALADVAKQEGQEAKVQVDIKRFGSDLPAELVSHVFDMPKPQGDKPVVDGVLMANGDYAVLSLSGVKVAADAVNAEQKTAIASQVNNLNGYTDFSSYQQYLQDTAELQ